MILNCVGGSIVLVLFTYSIYILYILFYGFLAHELGDKGSTQNR